MIRVQGHCLAASFGMISTSYEVFMDRQHCLWFSTVSKPQVFLIACRYVSGVQSQYSPTFSRDGAAGALCSAAHIPSWTCSKSLTMRRGCLQSQLMVTVSGQLMHILPQTVGGLPSTSVANDLYAVYWWMRDGGMRVPHVFCGSIKGNAV